MPNLSETGTRSAPLAAAEVERVRLERHLTSRLVDALKPHTQHGGPSLEAAQYLLARAQKEGLEIKPMWERARKAVGALYPWALPVPFSYEQALQVPASVQGALDSTPRSSAS